MKGHQINQLKSLCILLLLSTQGFTQTAPLGKEVIQKFSEQMDKNETTQVSFTFTLDNRRDNITNSYIGELTLMGSKYFMELMGMEVYFDGTTKWQFIPEANEVTISTPTSVEGGLLDNPTHIFSNLEKNFKSRFIGEKVMNGVAIYEVDLYPEDISEPYSLIKLHFEKKSLNPVSILYQGRDGTNYIFEVTSYRINKRIEGTFFNFDPSKYSDIEIVDLR